MQSTIKEMRVERQDVPGKIVYQVKEILLNENKVNIISSTNSSGNAAKAAEMLVKFGYVTYENVKTETVIINGRRITRMIITIKKTNDFDMIYKENEENRKKQSNNVKQN